jgi:hypothetical protein
MLVSELVQLGVAVDVVGITALPASVARTLPASATVFMYSRFQPM